MPRLRAISALLLHPLIVKNCHSMLIRGTVYQIALHEGDDELIDDVIKPAFEKLHHGLETMEAQRNAWLPDGWMEAEVKTCENACKAIDEVFTAFKNASDPNDVTELRQHPYTITINNQEVNKRLATFRDVIDGLKGYSILPLDSEPLFRLGYEHFGGDRGVAMACWWEGREGLGWILQNFLSIKNKLYSPASCNLGKGLHNNIVRVT